MTVNITPGYFPADPLPWWQWRNRRARHRFLERLARCEFQLSLDGLPIHAMSFEYAYAALVHNADADVVRGVSHIMLAKIDNGHGNMAEIVLRMPLDVKL
jgi:hypothetical protein